MFPYFDIQGNGNSSSILVVPGGVRLPDEPAKAVILSNWNVENEPTLTSKPAGAGLIEESLNEIYWGYNGVYAHQLFPSQTTNWILVNNLQQICLRCRPGDNIQIWYSWIR